MARLRSDFWASAYIRRCGVENVPAVMRRRGAPEAGAIFIKIDCLDGTAKLFGPAPQSEVSDNSSERTFAPVHRDPTIASVDAEARLKREIAFDPDLWLIEIDDRAGRSFLD